jgi:hypothetical protein
MPTTLKVVPTGEAAIRSGRSQRTIERWIVSGRLPGQRIGKILVADESAVAALEHGRQEGGESR